MDFLILITLLAAALWYFPLNLAAFVYWLVITNLNTLSGYYSRGRLFWLGGFAVLFDEIGLDEKGVAARHKALRHAKFAAVGAALSATLIYYNQHVTRIGLN